MVVERKEEKPPSPGLYSFNQHLDKAENMLHKMERYSHKLNVQIDDIKKLVATNRRVITRLQENEQRIKLLLEDSLTSPDNQVEPGKENSLKVSEQSVVKLGENVQKKERSCESHCRLRRTCKVTNIQEISWTQCKPSTDEGSPKKEQEQRTHSKAKMLLATLEKDLLQERGQQDGHPSVDLKQHTALIDKVNCILKIIENLDLRQSTIEKVKKVCKRALIAMFERQTEASSDASENEKSEKPRKRQVDPKVVKSHLSVIPKNPYLYP